MSSRRRSNLSRTVSQAHARLDEPPRLRTTLKEPAEVIAMIPYLLGFTPADSLVVVALVGPRSRLGPCLRLDLPHSEGDGLAQARYLVDVLIAHRFAPVILVAFTADASRADAVVRPLRRGLAQHRVTVGEALRADGRRWWSYTCHNPACCSPEGTPYDAESSRVAAEAVRAGLTRAPDRESLRAGFEPVSDEARRVTAAACAEVRQARASQGLGAVGPDELERLLRHRAAPGDMSPTDHASLLLAVQRAALRKAALARMNRVDAAADLELWRQVMRYAPDDLVAPAGALAGFAAWLDGQGPLAWIAVERVESVSPGYPMCRLLHHILSAAVSPDTWDELRSTLVGSAW
jgi:hypothetical protein